MKNIKFIFYLMVLMFVISGVIFAGIKAIDSRYIVGLDFREVRCLDAVLYLIKKNSFTKEDTCVAFYADERFQPYVKIGGIIFKKIIGTDKDYIKTEGKSIYLNGEYLTTAREFDSKGRPIKSFNYTGQIPENNYFVMGDNPRSYDSRYYGFISKDELIGGGKMLW